MNRAETVEIIKMVEGGCPGLTVTDAMPQVWHAVLSDLRVQDCRDAVVNLVTRSARYIAPADLRAEVRRIREKRHEATPLPDPPPDLTPLQTIEWQRATLRAIGDGTYRPDPQPELTRPMPKLPELRRP